MKVISKNKYIKTLEKFLEIMKSKSKPSFYENEIDQIATDLVTACRKADLYDELQKPKEPIKRFETDIVVGEYTAYDCPNCKQEQVLIFPDGRIVGVKRKYCGDCATALDWSKR